MDTDASADFEEEEPTAELVRDRAAAPPSTSRLRRPRRTRPRSKTIAMKQLTRAERELYAFLYPVDDAAAAERPRTRAECRGHEGPCPWVSCKHHLYLDINPLTGSI